MTQFYATVCLPNMEVAKVMPAVAAALAPYDIDAARYPAGKWDSWCLWSPAGHEIPVRPEYDGDPRLLHNDLWGDGSPRPRLALRCDGGPKGLLDLQRLRDADVASAQARWQAWAELASTYPATQPLSAFLAHHHDDPQRYSYEQAKLDHLLQPLVQEVAQRAVTQTDPHFGMHFLVNDPVEHFGGSRQEYIADAAALSFCTYALVSLEGNWRDESDESDANRFHRYMADYIDRLDDDAYVLRVRCHC